MFHTQRRIRICIVALCPGLTPISDLIMIMSRIAHEVYLVIPGLPRNILPNLSNVKHLTVPHRVSSGLVSRLMNSIITQFRVLLQVMKISKSVDLYLFSISGETFLLPLLGLKFMRQLTAFMPGGNAIRVSKINNDLLSLLIPSVVYAALELTHRIILYSSHMAKEAVFAKHKNKTIFAHKHFINFTRFMREYDLSERPETVGFIGRLSREKGVLSFVDAIPQVLDIRESVKFLICGDGLLLEEAKMRVAKRGLESSVRFTGWVFRQQIPDLLNSMKLMVQPSLTEGLPNSILEAMACGTPVLATPVGGIPDLIVESETGFFLRSRNPDHIAERICSLLGNTELLENVSNRAMDFVNQGFCFSYVVQSWHNVLAQLGLRNTKSQGAE